MLTFAKLIQQWRPSWAGERIAWLAIRAAMPSGTSAGADGPKQPEIVTVKIRAPHQDKRGREEDEEKKVGTCYGISMISMTGRVQMPVRPQPPTPRIALSIDQHLPLMKSQQTHPGALEMTDLRHGNEG